MRRKIKRESEGRGRRKSETMARQEGTRPTHAVLPSDRALADVLRLPRQLLKTQREVDVIERQPQVTGAGSFYLGADAQVH